MARENESGTQQTPMAEVGENWVFFLRKQDNGTRWPVGTKLYAETPLIVAAHDLLECLQNAAMNATGERRARYLAAIAKATGEPQ